MLLARVEMGVPHPIPYQGSKRNLAKWILQYFPQDAARLIEPFAGSAAISLAALYYGRVSQVLIGDIDSSLIELWKRIVESPEQISRSYAEIWSKQFGKEREYYNLIRTQFNQSHEPDMFLFLLARCVKAAVRYNSYGEFNQSPDNRRRGTRPETMADSIISASRLFRNRATIVHEDYRRIVDNATEDDIVYLDPPYQGVCSNRDPRYREKVTFENFVDTLRIMNAHRVSYIVSYDGRTDTRTYGNPLPASLDLEHIELDAGRSSQATLLGREDNTYESLYLSPALVMRLGTVVLERVAQTVTQLSLLED